MLTKLTEKSNYWQGWLLCAPRERPRRCRTADHLEEIVPSHEVKRICKRTARGVIPLEPGDGVGPRSK
jgi:hypothetical protein